MDTITLEDLDESHAEADYDVVQLVFDEPNEDRDPMTTAPIWIRPGSTEHSDREGEDETMRVLRVTTGTRDKVETRLRALDFDVDGFVIPD